VVPEGTRIDTFVDGDHMVNAASEPAAPAAVVAQAAPAPAAAPVATRAGLTNADVIALRQAGFGDELILAKIAASPSAYSVGPTDMVALKKAGVSERVITAMVAAK